MTAPIIRYKFLNGRKSSNGDITWRKNQWRKHGGEIGICKAGFHCSRHIQDALGFVQGDTLAIVEVRGKSIIQDDKECWQEMRVLKFIPFTKEHSVRMAVFAAKLCLPVFEEKYPDDKRPIQAIEAAEKYLDDPSDENRAASEAAWAASGAASGAASEAASRAAATASRAAWAASGAASEAAWAAAAASRAASRVVWAASEAVSEAVSEAASNQKIHEYMLDLLGATA